MLMYWPNFENLILFYYFIIFYYFFIILLVHYFILIYFILLVQSETHTASSRIWNRVSDSISYEDNSYFQRTSQYAHVLAEFWKFNSILLFYFIL